MKTYVLHVELEEDEDGRWSAWIEALPGCNAWGSTREKALGALEDAAGAYIEDILAEGNEVPREGVEVVEAPVVTVTI